MSTRGLSLSEPAIFARWSCLRFIALLSIMGLLDFLMLGSRAFGQRQGPSENEIGIVAGNSVGGIHLFGYADDREINLFGVQYTQPLGHFLGAQFDYTTEVLPVFVLSEPKEYGADSRALSSERKLARATGISPIGGRILWRPHRQWEPYLLGRGGILYFNNRVLSTRGTHLQFLAEFGAGIRFRVRPRTQLSFGYSFYHFSNGDIAARNPALDSNLIYSVLSFDLNRRLRWLP